VTARGVLHNLSLSLNAETNKEVKNMQKTKKIRRNYSIDVSGLALIVPANFSFKVEELGFTEKVEFT
jgi:hypothetical protein